MTKKNKWWLNGGRGSGRTFRLLWETYENKITELERLNSNQAKSLRVTMLEEEKKGKRIKELEQQIEKMKSDVISERDKAKRLEDVITYTVLNDILAKWEIKENE